MVLVQKWPFLSTFFFRQYRPGKCLLGYSRTKKGLSRLKKQQVKKVEKSDIFLKGLTYGFCTKMAIFAKFFLGNIGQRNVFYDILKQKKTFLDYKNNKFKKSKNWHFFKGVNPWLWPKNAQFFNFFKGT